MNLNALLNQSTLTQISMPTWSVEPVYINPKFECFNESVNVNPNFSTNLNALLNQSMLNPNFSANLNALLNQSTLIQISVSTGMLYLTSLR